MAVRNGLGRRSTSSCRTSACSRARAGSSAGGTVATANDCKPRPLGAVTLLESCLPAETDLRPSSRPERDTVEPRAQQVGVADGSSLAGKHEEHGLKGVLGMMPVAQALQTDAQNHWPMPGNQRLEDRFPNGIAAGDEPLQQLCVGQAGDRATLEERLDLPDNRPCRRLRHAGSLRRSDPGVALNPIMRIVPRRRSFYPRPDRKTANGGIVKRFDPCPQRFPAVPFLGWQVGGPSAGGRFPGRRPLSQCRRVRWTNSRSDGGELRQGGQIGGKQVEGLFSERLPFRQRHGGRSLAVGAVHGGAARRRSGGTAAGCRPRRGIGRGHRRSPERPRRAGPKRSVPSRRSGSVGVHSDGAGDASLNAAIAPFSSFFFARASPMHWYARPELG